MTVVGRFLRGVAFAAAGLSVTSWGARALALTQPDGATIPAAPGCDGGRTTGLAAELSCVCKEPGVCNQGAACPGGSSSCDPGTNGTCETTIWHEVNDDPCIPTHLSGLDPSTEAAVTPETFRPSCPQTFTVLTRGTALFQNAFGWYNVTGKKPAAADLHVMLDCNAQPGDSAVLDLAAEPGYAGGDVGFFLVTPEKPSGASGGSGSCGDLGCCATVAGAEGGNGFVYYSERQYNPDFVGSDSWIHLLTYQSHVFDDTFYFAWEDSNKSPNNDFTDLVTSVSGIRCSGGGVACATGSSGVCGAGVSVCRGGEIVCEPVVEASSEQCNGLDDDCDGAIDDDAVCPADAICHEGRCVPPCTTGEFPCGGGQACDQESGLCVPADCVGVDCPPGEMCRGASGCGVPCEGVVCPNGLECVGDRCVDLCDATTCAAGEVCFKGHCFAGCAQCDGLSCDGNLECDSSTGACADPSCAGGCAEGTVCSNGVCIDPCADAQCPPGQQCQGGRCCAPDECDTGAGGTGVGVGGGSGTSSQGGSAGAASSSSGSGAMPGNRPAGEGGCGCRVAPTRARHAAGLLALAGLALSRRRRSKSR